MPTPSAHISTGDRARLTEDAPTPSTRAIEAMRAMKGEWAMDDLRPDESYDLVDDLAMLTDKVNAMQHEERLVEAGTESTRS